jgi:hypothetical protein
MGLILEIGLHRDWSVAADTPGSAQDRQAHQIGSIRGAESRRQS